MKDHPRSRGVYDPRDENGPEECGSSPLARGLLLFLSIDASDRRIIPARAGFTALSNRPTTGTRDHPRSRGVYDYAYRHAMNVWGSSPLARGLPAGGFEAHRVVRIIPARAGFTCSGSRRGLPRRDHPRSRGVYRSRRGGGHTRPGSSPLARGLREPARNRLNRRRIIPARAGFTPSGCAGRVRSADHPRSRGVYEGVKVSWNNSAGSSPLARGLLAPSMRGFRSSGIIPARAGFTSGGLISYGV